MKYTVEYSSLLNAKEVAHLPKADLHRIKKAIEAKLTTQPEVFGKPLRFTLRGYRSLRVGDYRVIFRIEKETVKIFIIAHRSVVYEEYLSEIPNALLRKDLKKAKNSKEVQKFGSKDELFDVLHSSEE